MRINRYVLDTNVWVSYLINQEEQTLTNIVVEHKVIFYYCEELLIEIKRVLAYPHLSEYNINIRKAINFIKEIGVSFTLKQPIKCYIPEDENDNFIVALALQTSSGFITSGDKHILSRKSWLEAKYKNLKILTKREFESIFLKL